MTPFDPDALVAMLKAFYPKVSPAAFARARAERPEYFAGGVITRPLGDKLQLPDGRLFDCIQNKGGAPGTTFWICIDVTNDPGGPPDPFALEAGPLDVLDEDVIIFPGGEPAFEPLVVSELGSLDGAEGKLDAAAAGVVDAADPASLENSYATLIDPAIAAHAGLRAALDLDDPADVIDATNRHDGEIDLARGDYVETPPPDTPEPDLPDKPRDDDDGPPPKEL